MTMTGCQRNWHGKISTPPSRSYLPIFTRHSPRASGTKSIANRLSYYQICCRVKMCCHSLLPRWRRPSISNRKSTYCIAWGGVSGYLAKVKQVNYRMPLSHFHPSGSGEFDHSRDGFGANWWGIIGYPAGVWFYASGLSGFLQDAPRQAFCYLLGFYIGVTSSRLVNAPVRWVSLRRCMIVWARRLLNALSIVLYCCLRTVIARRCWWWPIGYLDLLAIFRPLLLSLRIFYSGKCRSPSGLSLSRCCERYRWLASALDVSHASGGWIWWHLCYQGYHKVSRLYLCVYC